MEGMTPGVWVAFAALMLTIVSGGITAAVFILTRIGALGTRLAVVETKLDQLLGTDTRRTVRHIGSHR